MATIVVRGGLDNPNVEGRSWLNSIAAMGTAGDAFWRSAAAGSAVAANKQRIAQSQQAMQFAQEERNLFNAESEDSAANAEHDALAMAGYDAGQNDPEVQSAVMGAVQQYGPPEAQQYGPPSPQAQQAPQLDPDEQIDLQAAQKFATEHLKTPQGRAQFWQNQKQRMKDRRVQQDTEKIAGRYQDLLVGLTNSGKAEMFKGQIEAAQGLLDQIRSPGTTPEVDARLAGEVAKIVGVVEEGWRKNEERMAVGAGLGAGLRETAARFGAKHPYSGRAMALATFIESGVYAPEMAQKLTTGMEAAFLGLVPSPMDPSGDTYVTEDIAKRMIQEQGLNDRAAAKRQADAQVAYQKSAADLAKEKVKARNRGSGKGMTDVDVSREARELYQANLRAYEALTDKQRKDKTPPTFDEAVNEIEAKFPKAGGRGKRGATQETPADSRRAPGPGVPVSWEKAGEGERANLRNMLTNLTQRTIQDIASNPAMVALIESMPESEKKAIEEALRKRSGRDNTPKKQASPTTSSNRPYGGGTR